MRRTFYHGQCGVLTRLCEVMCHPVISTLRKPGSWFEKCKTRQFAKYTLLTMVLIQLPIFMIAHIGRRSPRSADVISPTGIAEDIFERRQREIKKEGLGERKILVDNRNELTGSDKNNFVYNYAKKDSPDFSIHGK